MKYLGGGKVFADMEQGKADEILMIPVREIMTAADIKTVTSTTTLTEAAKMMIEYGVGVFPVLDGDELNGIVTEFDLVKALAE
ncbi:MAG TPA: CBS domain-containing protein [Methanocorpusculum sp.]|nr:CBS domain-containing protein [Methanocorpusculum sp.]